MAPLALLVPHKTPKLSNTCSLRNCGFCSLARIQSVEIRRDDPRRAVLIARLALRSTSPSLVANISVNELLVSSRSSLEKRVGLGLGGSCSCRGCGASMAGIRATAPCWSSYHNTWPCAARNCRVSSFDWVAFVRTMGEARGLDLGVSFARSNARFATLRINACWHDPVMRT